MSDYMQEADRLIDAFGRCKWAEGVYDNQGSMGPANTCEADAEQNRAALLAHIERGRVPEGWRDAMRRLTFAARTTGGTAGQDADLMAACDACEALLIAAAPAAPDHSAPVPAEVPMPEPVGWYVSGSDPEYAALWLVRPNDEQMQVMNQQGDDGPVTAQPLVLGADAKRYGDDREAAGYARGLELYNQLLFAVATKHPDETRHETALRYIRQAEESRNSGCQAA